MIKFALFLALLCAVFGVANVMTHDQGYVLVSFDQYTFEGSLWGVLLFLIIVGIGLWLVTLLVHALFSLLGYFVPLTPAARRRAARKNFVKGLLELTNGHWKKSEKLLGQSARYKEFALVSRLGAALSASRYGNTESSANWIRQADSKAPEAQLAIGITQAQVQISSQQWEQALATLTQLHLKYPKHVFILRLLKKVYERLSDWHALVELLPALRKQKVILDDEAKQLEESAYAALYEQAYQQGKHKHELAEKIRAAEIIWLKQSARARKYPDILFLYANCLYRLGAHEQAEVLLRDSLGYCYSSKLILLYGLLSGQDAQKQMLYAETLLKERPGDAQLLLTLGRLALRNELWGKAREYLETSLQIHPCVDVYNELGHLLAYLDDFEASTRYFQEGLRLASAADSVVSGEH